MYVSSLARQLQSIGVESIVAAPASTHSNSSYLHDGIEVRRFAVSDMSSDMLTELYGGGDPVAASEFAAILADVKPDVVHLHCWTRAVSVRLVEQVKNRHIKLFFTYHTPTASCERGTLMRFGRDVCDGLMKRGDCTRCTLHGLGVNGIGGKILSAVPVQIGQAVKSLSLSGGPWTVLRMTDLMAHRHAAFLKLMAQADGVIALCRWTQQLLLNNGVDSRKVLLSPHGLPHGNERRRPGLRPNPRPLRIAFLGRADRTKGADTLIRAIQSQPDLDVTLDLFGVVQGSGDEAYLTELKHIANNDRRFNFRDAIRSSEVVATLNHYHLLAVPSRWMETGPLVVLEAFAAGVPVIGSRLGGIAELVRHNHNGLLIEAESTDAWANGLTQLHEDPTLLNTLQRNVQPPRSMSAVAEDMMAQYSRQPS